MDKYNYKDTFYKKLTSTTLISTGKESSVTTLPPVRQQPVFLGPVDPARGKAQSQDSLISKLCGSVCRLNWKYVCAGVPCIDRFLSQPRKKGSQVKYRRPKSYRQLQLANSDWKARHMSKTGGSTHALKPSYHRRLPLEEDTIPDAKPLKLSSDLNDNFVRDEGNVKRLLPPVLPRNRPRKMYTPDGKIIRYVVPCHSDSSLSDKKTKMTQVNSISLVQIQSHQNVIPQFILKLKFWQENKKILFRETLKVWKKEFSSSKLTCEPTTATND